MPDWAAFVGIAGVVLVLLLVLARLSQSSVRASDGDRRASEPDPWAGPGGDPRVDGARARNESADVHLPHEAGESAPADEPTRADESTTNGSPTARASPTAAIDAAPGRDATADRDAPAAFRRTDADPSDGGVPIDSTAGLLVNVAISQGAFAALLVVGAWVTGVPAAAFGLGPAAFGVGSIAAGLALGISLYAANELGAALGDRVGLGRSEDLREALAPDSAAGWAVLLVLVLPLIAGFEELLFRGAMIGVASIALDVSPWLMAALSSVAFALGHGAQGPAGIIVTGVLGFVLAAAFVLTESLVAVVVAHYLVNALEFAVHEGVGVEWLPERDP